MSRLLLNNMLLQSANIPSAAITSQTVGNTSRQSQSVAFAVRRWKSLLRCNNRQRFNALLSPSSATSVKLRFANKSANSSVLSSSSVNNSITCTTFNQHLQQQQSFSSYTNSASASRTYSTMPSKFLSLDNINPNFINMEYAVRGPIVTRAGEIEKELEKGVKKPFKEVIRANIGDCHAMGQRPITFLRQLLTLTYDTSLLNSPQYPEDVKSRARAILNSCHGGSVGSYTETAGIEIIRKQVADFISKRDGFPCDWQKIFLTGGASPGIKSVLALMNCVVDGKPPGVLIPIPQYPLYSATIAEYGMNSVGYYLEEETNWSLSRAELQKALDSCKGKYHPRALVVINPGNPTGQVLNHENIVEVIKFAYENKLCILADEVYQDNIYDKNSKFFSFKKVLMEMGSPYKDMELASFMSTSKGYLGECGIRGGYMEIINFSPDVLQVLTKCLTASLCSTAAGQIAVSALVNPPQPGEPSYEQYIKERSGVLNTLKERAELVYNTLNSFEGFKVNVVQGAMYVFPQIVIPPKAVEAAKAKGLAPDAFYAFELLEATGICIIPGSGFGQKPGTYHFRTTILPQTDVLKRMMQLFKVFHADFMKKYK